VTATEPTEPLVPRVNGGRLLSHLNELRSIGATPAGGVSRPSFGPDDIRARAYTAGLMAAAGLVTETDTAGNLIGRTRGPGSGSPRSGSLKSGSQPGALLLGSHLDTVADGGWLDGAYGVLAAIEVLHTLGERSAVPAVPVAVVAFANEEGAPGTPAMSGSSALAGVPLEFGSDGSDGAGGALGVLGAGLAAVGGDLSRLTQARWGAAEIAGYLELHIEQGPVLERERIPIGVVTAITGRTSVDVRITGMANHAGTTPMSYRHDALAAAARLILAVQELAGPLGPVRVATVGCCSVERGAWNVVPGAVSLCADLRDISSAAMQEAVRRLRHFAADLESELGIAVELTVSQVVEPVSCAPDLADLIATAAKDVGVDHMTLPSGAGHDAQLIGRVAPIGMIFVPSIGGVSHHPAEDTAAEDLVCGADVLLNTVLAFDRDHQRG
jgi:N-carbamoyl-L-amino-acid hydrolase